MIDERERERLTWIPVLDGIRGVCRMFERKGGGHRYPAVVFVCFCVRISDAVYI